MMNPSELPARPLPEGRYDPLPDLAALLASMRSLVLRPGWQDRPADTRAVLAGLELGAVGRLAHGLRLGQPGGPITAEAALRGLLALKPEPPEPPGAKTAGLR
jgi:hypothetical protein